jgi:hypothetical protein
MTVSSSDLPRTYRYSDIVPTPSSCAIRRMESPASPSVSAIRIAVDTIASTSSPGFGPRLRGSRRPQSSRRLSSRSPLPLYSVILR